MQKPISLNSLRFSDTKGNFIVQEEYSLTFSDFEKLETFIQARSAYWKEMYKMNLVITPNHNETLSRSDIFAIFMFTAKYFNIPQIDILKRTKKSEIIEARRYGIALCIERGIKPQHIAREIRYDHATIGHHRDLFYKFCDTEKGYHNTYMGLEEYVLEKLNGRFKEDGSGEKAKPNE